MKTLVLAAALSLITTGAFAEAMQGMPGMQGMNCKMQAAEKKLAGAAMNSFMKKCETEAGAACEADSKAKKLAGAAKTSHMKKCVTDRVGS